MRSLVLTLTLLMISTAYASSKKVVCHDQFLEDNSQTFFWADVVSSTELKNIEIQSKDVILKKEALVLKPSQVSGFNILASGEHATQYKAMPINGAKYSPDFTVSFWVGEAWLSKEIFSAQMFFYCDECGGMMSLLPNMYCRLE